MACRKLGEIAGMSQQKSNISAGERPGVTLKKDLNREHTVRVHCMGLCVNLCVWRAGGGGVEGGTL
jgi:hypothetical protein